MPDYTTIAIFVLVAVVAMEFFWFRTGIFRSKAFWISMAIVVFFQSIVDGLLTRGDRPVVAYNPDTFSGIRFPFSIPVEDWLFGFSLVSLSVMMWMREGARTKR